MDRGVAGGVGHADHAVDHLGHEGGLHARTADALDVGGPVAGDGAVARVEVVEEHRVLGIGHAELGVILFVADVAADGGRGAARAGADHDPGWDRVGFGRHLGEDRVGDVVVAAPVRYLLGVGELVHVVAIEFTGQALGFAVYVGVLHQVAFAAIERDLVDLLPGGALGHHGDEGQVQEFGKIGLGHGRAARGGLDDRGPFIDPPVAEPVEKQRAGQAMLEASGGVGGFVLEIELDICDGRQFHLDQVGVRRPLEIGLDFTDGLVGPCAHAWRLQLR